MEEDMIWDDKEGYYIPMSDAFPYRIQTFWLPSSIDPLVHWLSLSPPPSSNTAWLRVMFTLDSPRSPRLWLSASFYLQ